MLNEADSFTQLSISNFINNQPIDNVSNEQDLRDLNFDEANERKQESAERQILKSRLPHFKQDKLKEI